ncbi:MAG: GNAT family N-acetyltransferase [Acidimicrobiales bacterium]
MGAAAGSGRTVRVREPVPGDSAGIGRVHVRAWQQAYAGIMAASFLDGLDERAWGRAWRRRLAQRAVGRGEPGVELLVAEHPDGGTVAGIATLGPERGGDGNRGELWMINVDPAAWGLGVGSALLAEVEARLAARGFTDGVLWVVAGNSRARRFYRTRGWAADDTCRREDIGGRPVNECRYTKPLVGNRRRSDAPHRHG